MSSRALSAHKRKRSDALPLHVVRSTMICTHASGYGVCFDDALDGGSTAKLPPLASRQRASETVLLTVEPVVCSGRGQLQCPRPAGTSARAGTLGRHVPLPRRSHRERRPAKDWRLSCPRAALGRDGWSLANWPRPWCALRRSYRGGFVRAASALRTVFGSRAITRKVGACCSIGLVASLLPITDRSNRNMERGRELLL